MRVLILGATGRVGAAAVGLASARGHEVTAFVRDPKRLAEKPRHMAIGDIGKPETLDAALAPGVDAILNALGVDPLKPSHFVTDAARVVTRAARQAGVQRYVAISGTANMPTAFLGALSLAILKLTPVRHAIADHAGAYEIVRASQLNWTLAGCPWIKDGDRTGRYTEHERFPGGMKSIRAGDVADFLVNVLDDARYANRLVGIWN